MNKGQWKAGTAHRHAKLTERDVRAIRRDYRPWSITLRDLAARHGVSVVTVWKVVQGQSYQNVEGAR